MAWPRVELQPRQWTSKVSPSGAGGALRPMLPLRTDRSACSWSEGKARQEHCWNHGATPGWLRTPGMPRAAPSLGASASGSLGCPASPARRCGQAPCSSHPETIPSGSTGKQAINAFPRVSWLGSHLRCLGLAEERQLSDSPQGMANQSFTKPCLRGRSGSWRPRRSPLPQMGGLNEPR